MLQGKATRDLPWNSYAHMGESLFHWGGSTRKMEIWGQPQGKSPTPAGEKAVVQRKDWN